MNTEKKAYYDIVDGPSKDVLLNLDLDRKFLTLMRAPDRPIGFDVVLSLIPDGDVVMSFIDLEFSSIEHDDGSSESFYFRGHCIRDYASRSLGEREPSYTKYWFSGWYNFKLRKGGVDLIEI